VVFFICSFFNFQFGLLAAERWNRRNRHILGSSLLLSAAALFLNPIGVRQVFYPLNTLLHQRVGLSMVAEWMPPPMNSGRGLGVLVVLAIIVLAVIVQRSELFWGELVVLALGTALAISHRRMVFVFGILAAPILSRLLSTCWEGYDAARDRRRANAFMMAMSVAIAFFAFPKHANLAAQVSQKSPVRAVKFIQGQHLSGNMLNEYEYGGYLIWAAPEHPVFIDGRADVFEWTGVLSEFGRWVTVQSNPNTLLDKYNIDFCLLSRTSPMAYVLPLLPNWKQVYAGAKSVIFVRTTSPAQL
jgi:hypothetical protein